MAVAALFVACEQKPAPKQTAVPPVPPQENAVPKSAEPTKPVDAMKSNDAMKASDAMKSTNTTTPAK